MKTRAVKSACGLAMAATTFLAAMNLPANATENGGTTTPFGIADFGAGMMPPPSPYGTFGIRTAYYSADYLRDGSGNKIDPDFDIDVKTIGLAYIKMTETKFLGASVGFGTVIPFMDISGSLTVPTPGGPLDLSDGNVALGDIQVMPLILQWNMPPNWFINTSLQVQAPTGAYDVDKTFNVGTNHWAIAPVVGATYLTDSGFELSSRMELNFNTRNPATDYTSGIEYKHEFAAGQHIGDWTVGLGGYYYQQITDDKGPSVTDGNRGRVFALGPAVSYFKPGKPVVSFHAYKEFGAQNRAEGLNVALRIGMSF